MSEVVSNLLEGTPPARPRLLRRKSQEEEGQADREIIFQETDQAGPGDQTDPEDQVVMDLAALVAHLPAGRRVPTPVAAPR